METYFQLKEIKYNNTKQVVLLEWKLPKNLKCMSIFNLAFESVQSNHYQG